MLFSMPHMEMCPVSFQMQFVTHGTTWVNLEGTCKVKQAASKIKICVHLEEVRDLRLLKREEWYLSAIRVREGDGS